MKKAKRLISMLLVLAMLISLAACTKAEEDSKESEEATEQTTVKIGCSILEKDMIEALKEDFEAKGYVMEISVFDDMITPNAALQEGSIDVNYYQFPPYLDSYNEEKGADLVCVSEPIYICPVGVFSNKITDLNELPDGAKVAVNNDTTNRARALEVLEEMELIKLDPNVEYPTKNDIIENPKNLEILEMEDGSLPQVLDDVELSLMYSLTATFSGLTMDDALFIGGIEDKYGITLAVRNGDEEAEWIADLMEVFTSDKSKDFLNETYDGACVPMF